MQDSKRQEPLPEVASTAELEEANSEVVVPREYVRSSETQVAAGERNMTVEVGVVNRNDWDEHHHNQQGCQDSNNDEPAYLLQSPFYAGYLSYLHDAP